MAIIQSVNTYFRESIEELRKVSWPSKQETTNHTVAVVVVSLGIAVFFGIVDYLLTQGLSYLLSQ